MTEEVAVERDVLKNLIELARAAIELDSKTQRYHEEKGRYVCPAAMKMVHEFAKEFDKEFYELKNAISIVQREFWNNASAIQMEDEWKIFPFWKDGKPQGDIVGTGPNELDAWRDAAKKLQQAAAIRSLGR